MSFWNTRREELHMERMEDNAALANRIEIDRTDKLEAHHERMQYLREREIENEVFTLTLKGDEARDYNKWKCLRDKHREVTMAALSLQAVAKFIDKAIEVWISDSHCRWYEFKPQLVEDFVRYVCKEINDKLHPTVGRGILDISLISQDETKSLVDKILGKEQ